MLVWVLLWRLLGRVCMTNRFILWLFRRMVRRFLVSHRELSMMNIVIEETNKFYYPRDTTYETKVHLQSIITSVNVGTHPFK